MFFVGLFLLQIVQAKLWNQSIPYVITEDLPHQERIMEAMQYVSQRTYFDFVEHTMETDYMLFRHSTTGCSAQIGRRNGPRNINIADHCEVPIVIHEIGHSLGILHEHQRKDRKEKVLIQYENIIEEKIHNFYIRNETIETSYDFDSIMHYGRYFFTKNGKETITTLNDTSCTVGQYADLTETDIVRFNNRCWQCPHRDQDYQKEEFVICGGKSHRAHNIFGPYIYDGKYYKQRWHPHRIRKKFAIFGSYWEIYIIYKLLGIQVYDGTKAYSYNLNKWYLLDKTTNQFLVDRQFSISDKTKIEEMNATIGSLSRLILITFLVLFLTFLLYKLIRYLNKN